MTAFTSNLTDGIIPLEGRCNFIQNPSFEVDLTTWSALIGATLTRITSDFLYGIACLQVDSTALASSGARYAGTNVRHATGEVWTASGYVKAKTGGDVGKTIVIHLNENGGGESTQSIVLSSSWQRVSVSRTIVNTSNNNFVDS